MNITCPDCQFTREVDETKIPASARMATCPKCGTKFRFREDPEDGGFGFVPGSTEEPAENSVPAAPVEPSPEDHSTESAPGPVHHEEDAVPAARHFNEHGEPDKPGKSAPRPEDLDPRRHGDDTDEPFDTPENSPSGSSRDDIWDRLDSMGSERPSPDRFDDALDDEDFSFEVPWERLDQWGFFPGLLTTVKGAMLAPREFFRGMRAHGSLAKPLSFYVLLSVFVAVMDLGRMALDLPSFSLLSRNLEQAPELSNDVFLNILMSPVVSTVLLFVAAGFNHLFLMAFRAADKGFPATFRALAYASAPMIFMPIPFIGAIMGSMWSLFCTIIAYREVHRSSTGRVVAAIFAPLVMLFVIALFYGVFGGMQA